MSAEPELKKTETGRQVTIKPKPKMEVNPSGFRSFYEFKPEEINWHTILIVEGGEKVTWTRFHEYKFEPAGALPAMGLPGKDVFQVAMASGEVRTIKKTIDPAVMKALITRAGDEIIPDVLK